VFDAAALASGVVQRSLVPAGRGPTGLTLDEAHDRLYVFDRFAQSVNVVADVSTASRRLAQSVPLQFDPSPARVLRGRPFLYDAGRSGHGDSSCATCHLFGDADGLAWDLGNPYGDIIANPNGAMGAMLPPWAPMKGPMVTQSLRGMADMGPMHWRGDRTGGLIPGGDPADEAQAFAQFNPAFVGLLGAESPLPAHAMQAFGDFALTIVYPPNPLAQLDGQRTPEEQNGRAAFQSLGCTVCHPVSGLSSGLSISLLGEEGFKIPHLRNLYQKVGEFGQTFTGFEFFGFGFPMSPFMGDQIRGFGYFHDGTIASLFDVVGQAHGASDETRLNVVAFLLAMPTGLAAAVGQQVLAGPTTVGDPASLARRDLLAARAAAGDCDVVVKWVDAGAARGGRYVSGAIVTDRASEPSIGLAEFWSHAATPGAEQLYTCVPPGSGDRIGLDRDEDGARDRDELDAGTNPADPLSWPGGPVARMVLTKALVLRGSGTEPVTLSFRGGPADDTMPIAPPLAGGADDPTLVGATLRVYNAAGTGEHETIELPASGWTAYPGGAGYRFRGAGAVKRVVVKARKLTVRATLTELSLDEPAQRRLVVRLASGGVEWCAAASSAQPTATVDEPGRFRVRRLSAEPSCPAPPRE
jgi:hypothetical protein